MDWEKDVTICCLKQGEKYGPDWVNRLYRMVQNTGQLIGFSFVCFTDDTEGIDPWIQTEPLPYDALGWWGKMGLYMPALPGVETRRILYLDLDVVVTGDLHKMLELKTDFAIMRDYPSAQFGDDTFRGRQGNTSVILLTVGSHTEIWDGYMGELSGERKYLHWGDQEWLNMRFPGVYDRLPEKWVQSYKLHFLQEKFPEGCLVVAFHGEPKPCDCEGWVKELWGKT